MELKFLIAIFYLQQQQSTGLETFRPYQPTLEEELVDELGRSQRFSNLKAHDVQSDKGSLMMTKM